MSDSVNRNFNQEQGADPLSLASLEVATEDLRHHCRNSRCRAKLPAPVSNAREAFCGRGCHACFYRTCCRVCEEPIEQPPLLGSFGFEMQPKSHLGRSNKPEKTMKVLRDEFHDVARQTRDEIREGE